MAEICRCKFLKKKLNKVALDYILSLFNNMHTYYCCVFLVLQQPEPSPGRLSVEVSRSHTHTRPVGHLCTSDQLVAEAIT
jgi:hypothetical protein